VVVACASGEEALRYLEEVAARAEHGEHEGADSAANAEGLPHLLLSDIALGAGMRGTELAQRVHQGWPEIAVLLMSGFSVELLASGPEAALGWELLPKPYTRADLARAIGKVLAR
jgi:DNA-binding NtrC family response regulator